MDLNKGVIVELNTNLNHVIKLNGSVGGGNEKKKVARRRWAILAKALKSPTGSEPSSPTDEFSVRRISSFMLLKTQQLPTVPANSISANSANANPRLIDQINKRTWYKYSLKIDDTEYSVNVGHRNRTFSAEDLMGFNNTGNVCIWPSEETLTFYVCSNLHIFLDKTVLELGGGMSCLAGLFVCKYGGPRHVTVTDGNKVSVDNVFVTLQCNDFKSINCKVLKWGVDTVSNHFDVILCADCLFFDDVRNDLIDCLWDTLADNGLALIMAPQRSYTLDSFITQAQNKGFKCVKKFNYNSVVWQKRLALLDNCDYDDNIHYPILIELTKI